MKDDFGNRIKDQYEDRTRFMLPRRTYTIIRLDGKAFHTFTKKFKRPFDTELMKIMDATARGVCKQIQGAKFAYTQSDEISILVTDFTTTQTDAWFDGNIQKIVSVSASIATAEFNLAYYLNDKYLPAMDHYATFDSRVFTIPDRTEVGNYFIWRQLDATRNSIQMAARAVFSHKECENKNVSQLQEMLFSKGVNWNDYTAGEKRGRVIVKKTFERPMAHAPDAEPKFILRTEWVAEGAPIFTQEKDFFKTKIPHIGETDV